MKRTALLRSTPMPRRRLKPRTHKFCVRLTGAALRNLRWQCWIRDLKHCVECGVATFWEARFDGDPLAYDMAHIQSRGAGGSDTLENVQTKCHECHMAEHNGRSL